MASEQQVRQYLAYWFQLGKRVMLRNGQEAVLPQPVISGDRYSPAFEDCWQRVTAEKSGDCYLEATDQTITELLSPKWEINPCSRCSMPVPVPVANLPPESCVCSDLEGWPNTEVPQPRAPVSTEALLLKIRNRLRNARH